MPSLPQYEHQTYLALRHLLPPELTIVIAQYRFQIFTKRISSFVSPLKNPANLLTAYYRDGSTYIHTEVFVNRYLRLDHITHGRAHVFRVYWRGKFCRELNMRTNVWEKHYYERRDLAPSSSSDEE
jgi:hypothetical protein